LGLSLGGRNCLSVGIQSDEAIALPQQFLDNLHIFPIGLEQCSQTVTERACSPSEYAERTMRVKARKNDELGPYAAGQSGDIQQIPDVPEADSESVEELVEEGNAFEADAVTGVEEALDPDISEVTTREVPEDDVPREYLEDEDEHVA
jgi:N utilization substance protein A